MMMREDLVILPYTHTHLQLRNRCSTSRTRTHHTSLSGFRTTSRRPCATFRSVSDVEWASSNDIMSLSWLQDALPVKPWYWEYSYLLAPQHDLSIAANSQGLYFSAGLQRRYSLLDRVQDKHVVTRNAFYIKVLNERVASIENGSTVCNGFALRVKPRPKGLKMAVAFAGNSTAIQDLEFRVQEIPRRLHFVAALGLNPARNSISRWLFRFYKKESLGSFQAQDAYQFLSYRSSL